METAVAEAPALDADQSADVVVIGSGIAGMSTAYELTGRGRSVIVLERDRIGSGMTARTTAHLASVLDDCYAHLIDARGIEIARMVHQSQARGDRPDRGHPGEPTDRVRFSTRRRLFAVGSWDASLRSR
jgi:glycine/D-amino acid oxidase-like deaminating enzyme